MSIPRWLHQKKFQTRAEQAIGRTGLKPAYDPNPAEPQQIPAHEGLVPDPMGALAGAELAFADYQYSTGMDLIRQGLEPQTCAELQNLQLAQEMKNVNPVVDQQVSPTLQSQPQFQQFNANRMQPLSAMSTVPGGMGFQSTMPKLFGG